MDKQAFFRPRARQRFTRGPRIRGRGPLAGLVVAGVLLLAPVFALLHVDAASAFASPAFQSQWQQGEVIAPNFWGPLSLARDGQNEPYIESPGGQRLVQYFDKARMELTNPITGVVTNGLLATELITGNRQLGDNAFQPFPPGSVPVAGDPDNLGPTYAQIKANGATLLEGATTQIGSPTTRSLSASGTPGSFAAGSGFAQASIAAFDDTTKHNVPAAFAAYRDRAGLLTIGLAISEPFWANVKVAGQQRDVLMQAFERRVLTFTPSNPAAFQVEFGNIGQHYYTWRYVTNPGGGGGTGTGTATTSPTTTPTITPTAPTLTHPTVTNVTANKATIAYTTDVAACGTAEIRIKGDTNFATNIDSITCTPGTSVTVTLTSLDPSTQYEVRGAVKVGSGPVGYSDIAPFTTLSAQPTVESYEGTWINDTPNTSGIIRIVIEVIGNSLKSSVYDKCGAPQDCRVVVGTTPFGGDPVSDTYAAGLVSDKLTIGFTDNTRTHLKVVEIRTTAGGSPVTSTYTFHRRIIFPVPPVLPPGTLSP